MAAAIDHVTTLQVYAEGLGELGTVLAVAEQAKRIHGWLIERQPHILKEPQAAKEAILDALAKLQEALINLTDLLMLARAAQMTPQKLAEVAARGALGLATPQDREKLKEINVDMTDGAAKARRVEKLALEAPNITTCLATIRSLKDSLAPPRATCIVA